MVVVLPTPPFWLATAMTRGSSRAVGLGAVQAARRVVADRRWPHAARSLRPPWPDRRSGTTSRHRYVVAVLPRPLRRVSSPAFLVRDPGATLGVRSGVPGARTRAWIRPGGCGRRARGIDASPARHRPLGMGHAGPARRTRRPTVGGAAAAGRPMPSVGHRQLTWVSDGGWRCRRLGQVVTPSAGRGPVGREPGRRALQSLADSVPLSAVPGPCAGCASGGYPWNAAARRLSWPAGAARSRLELLFHVERLVRRSRPRRCRERRCDGCFTWNSGQAGERPAGPRASLPVDAASPESPVGLRTAALAGTPLRRG